MRVKKNACETGLVWRGLQVPLYFSVCVPAAAQAAGGSLVLAPEQTPLLALGAGAIGLFSPCEEEPVWCRHKLCPGLWLILLSPALSSPKDSALIQKLRFKIIKFSVDTENRGFIQLIVGRGQVCSPVDIAMPCFLFPRGV